MYMKILYLSYKNYKQGTTIINVDLNEQHYWFCRVYFIKWHSFKYISQLQYSWMVSTEETADSDLSLENCIEHVI